jgi:hypothetical protein
MTISEILDEKRFMDIEGYMTHATQQEILDFAKATAFVESTIYDNGERKDSKVRKSESKVVLDGESQAIDALKARLLNMLYEKQEQANVGVAIDLVRYNDKGFLVQHQDPYMDGRKYNREYTAIMYIKKPMEKGRTIYPNLNLTIEPNERKMFLFKNIYNGKLDASSVHMGEETVGEKIILVFFLSRELEYKIS